MNPEYDSMFYGHVAQQFGLKYMDHYGWPKPTSVQAGKCSARFWDGSALHPCHDTTGHIDQYHVSSFDSHQWKDEESCCGFLFNDNSKQGFCVSKQGLKSHFDPLQVQDGKLLLRHQMLDVKTFLLFEVFEGHAVAAPMHSPKYMKTPQDKTVEQAQKLLDSGSLPPAISHIIKDLMP